MIKNLKSDALTEICEQFLLDHEGALKILAKYCNNFGIHINELEIKNCITEIHSSVDFDNVVCFGIELSENQLYKKFHPA